MVQLKYQQFQRHLYISFQKQFSEPHLPLYYHGVLFGVSLLHY